MRLIWPCCCLFQRQMPYLWWLILSVQCPLGLQLPRNSIENRSLAIDIQMLNYSLYNSSSPEYFFDAPKWWFSSITVPYCLPFNLLYFAVHGCPII